MTPPNSLLDALRIPRKIVVHDKIAELQIDTFRSGLRGDQDRCFIAEMIDQCRA
jgi:hypothetical protein